MPMTLLTSLINRSVRQMKHYINLILQHKGKVITASLTLVAIGFVAIKWQHPVVASKSLTPYVKTATVTLKSLPLEADAIGSLVAKSVTISPEMTGHISKVSFNDGDHVKQNDKLYQLDDAVYRAKYASSMAKYSYSKTNYQRMVMLGKKGAVAKQAIDEAKATLGEAKAAADEAQVLLQKQALTAPFSGVVDKSLVSSGEYVTGGQPLVKLVDNAHLRLEYVLPEQYLPNIKLGQTVRLHTAAYPDKTFSGRVAFIAPSVNPESRTVALYATIENSDGLLSPGMFVDIAHVLAKSKSMALIPERSLIPILDGQQVYTLTNGKAYAKKIKIGARHGDMVEVLDGLKKEDVIITDGQMKLKNGSQVNVAS